MKDNQQTPKGAVRANPESGGATETPAANITTEVVNRAEVGAPLTVTTPEGATPDSTEAPVEAPPPSEPKPRYTVAEGRSITSLKGIIDAGGEVRHQYFFAPEGDKREAQQKAALQALVAAGVVVDNHAASK